MPASASSRCTSSSPKPRPRRVEVRESGAEGGALAQDHQPGQPRLERLQREPLEQRVSPCSACPTRRRGRRRTRAPRSPTRSGVARDSSTSALRPAALRAVRPGRPAAGGHRRRASESMSASRRHVAAQPGDLAVAGAQLVGKPVEQEVGLREAVAAQRDRQPQLVDVLGLQRPLGREVPRRLVTQRRRDLLAGGKEPAASRNSTPATTIASSAYRSRCSTRRSCHGRAATPAARAATTRVD